MQAKLVKWYVFILYFVCSAMVLAQDDTADDVEWHWEEIAQFGTGLSQDNVTYEYGQLSPDKTFLAIKTENAIEVWDLTTQKLISTINNPTGVFAWNPDSTQIATITLDDELFVWDIFTGDLVRSYNGLNISSNGVRAISWFQSDKIITGSFEYFIWDITSQVLPEIVSCHPWGSLLWWSPNGQYIATMGSESALIWICDSDFERLLSIEGYTTMAWSPNSEEIATVGIYNTLRIWHVASGEPIATMPGGEHNILEIIWHESGDILTTRHSGGEIRLWERQTPDAFWLSSVVDILGVNDIAWLNDQLLTISEEGVVQIWEFESH